MDHEEKVDYIEKAKYLCNHPEEASLINNVEERSTLIMIFLEELISPWDIDGVTYEKAKEDYPYGEFPYDPYIFDSINENILSDQRSLEVLYYLSNENVHSFINTLIFFLQNWSIERGAAVCNKHQEIYDKKFLNYLNSIYENIITLFADLYNQLEYSKLKILLEGIFFNHFVLLYDKDSDVEGFFKDRSWSKKIQELKNNEKFNEFVAITEKEYFNFIEEMNTESYGYDPYDSYLELEKYIKFLGIIGSDVYKNNYLEHVHFITMDLETLDDNKFKPNILFEDIILLKYYDTNFVDNFKIFQENCRKEKRKRDNILINRNTKKSLGIATCKESEEKEARIDIIELQKDFSVNFPVILERLLEEQAHEIDEEMRLHIETENLASMINPKTIRNVHGYSMKFLMELFNDNGMNLWDLLIADTRTFLKTGEKLFKFLIKEDDDDDFAPACIEYTRALEKELNKHFYLPLINYCKSIYKTDYHKWPKSLIRSNRSGVELDYFSLGKINSLLTYNYRIVVDAIKADYIKIKDKHKIDDILEFINVNCNTVRIKYRNKAAHRDCIPLKDGNECRDLMLTTSKFLVEVMRIFS